MAAEDDLADYPLQEKLQLLIDLYLNNFLPNWEFVCDSINMIMQSPSILFKDVAPLREEFVELIRNLLTEPEQAGGIAQSPFTDATAKLANDYLLALFIWWVLNNNGRVFSKKSLYSWPLLFLL